jgi:hypothetical protein
LRRKLPGVGIGLSATDFVARPTGVVELLSLLIILLQIVCFVITFGNSCFALFALFGLVWPVT